MVTQFWYITEKKITLTEDLDDVVELEEAPGKDGWFVVPRGTMVQI